MDTSLTRRRRHAAQASGGISGDAIHAMAMDCLRRHGAAGAALDFGAGQGGFAARLLDSGLFAAVAAIDLMTRPPTLARAIAWHQADLNEPIALPGASFDTVAALEVIEHLENPRHFFRGIARLLKPRGLLVVTTPNCESLRAAASLLVRGYFAGFGPDSYPAHITPLLRIDLERAAAEAGLQPIGVAYSGRGAVPGLTRLSWQSASLGAARGKRFSDNFAVICRKP